MQVKNKITGKIYQKLIEYASKKCDAVMFVTKQRLYELDFRDRSELEAVERTIGYIEKEFRNDLLKKRTDSLLIGLNTTFISSDPESVGLGIANPLTGLPYDDGFGIYFHKFSTEIKKYLLSNDNLYYWLNPEYPENLGFFKDGYCWLSSDAKGKLCHIYCDDEVEYSCLKSIGIEFTEDRYMPIAKDEKPFEGYGGIKQLKDVLFMNNLEYEHSLGLLSDAEKIKRHTCARKNTHYLREGNIYLNDSIKLNPEKAYKFQIECLYESADMKTTRVNRYKTINAKSGVVIEVPPSHEEILAGKKAKNHIFWFSDKSKSGDLVIKPNIDRVRVYFAYTSTEPLIDDAELSRIVRCSPDELEKYSREEVQYKNKIETPFTAFDAGIRVKKISKNKRIYHCRVEWHHGQDDLVFSIEWSPVE